MTHSPFPPSTISCFCDKQTGDGRKLGTLQKLTRKFIGQVRVHIPQQIHSSTVALIGEPSDKNITYHKNTDGLVTRVPNTLLSVLSADCVPILYSTTSGDIIGISHGGWKGTLIEIPSRVIMLMKELGAQPDEILVYIGPSIRSCCYPIWGERLEMVKKFFNDDVIYSKNGMNYFDLVAANRKLLRDAGILSKNISVKDDCTSCDKNRFWSYHRDKNIEGEMLSYIMIS